MSKLEQQYSTGKKIQRPSEDPIIAVRALKLRTNLSEIRQYAEKNIPDAMSWMNVTESALTTVNDIIKQINTYCVQGSSDTLTAKDRNSIVQNLSEMRTQILQEGNSNYAGRYVFTGYKTDTSLVFAEDSKNLNYEITEIFSGKDIQMGSRVSGAYRMKDFDENPAQNFEEAPKLESTYRIQLSYQDLNDVDMTSISYSKVVGNEEPVPQQPFTNIKTVLASDADAYSPEDGQVHFIPETGELILGKDAYEELRTAVDINIDYEKNRFKKDELRPEHYFNCRVTDSTKPEVEPIEYKKEPQEIQYEVNFNQKLKINVEGSDAFSHGLGRMIDDIMNSVNDVIDTEKTIAEVNKRLEDTNLTQEVKSRYEAMLSQLDTELTLRKEVMQAYFSSGITVSNEEQNRVNVQVADLGSRYVRLELTENRVSSQKVDFEDLLSSNEDADAVETIIKFNSAQSIYNASLAAAAKTVKTSLLDFL